MAERRPEVQRALDEVDDRFRIMNISQAQLVAAQRKREAAEAEERSREAGERSRREAERCATGDAAIKRQLRGFMPAQESRPVVNQPVVNQPAESQPAKVEEPSNFRVTESFQGTSYSELIVDKQGRRYLRTTTEIPKGK